MGQPPCTNSLTHYPFLSTLFHPFLSTFEFQSNVMQMEDPARYGTIPEPTSCHAIQETKSCHATAMPDQSITFFHL